MNQKIIVYFILIVSFTTNVDCNDDEYSLIDLSDEEIQDELRRRSLGGPHSPENAVSILNSAIDLISSSTNRSTGERKFEHEAQQIQGGPERLRMALDGHIS